MKKRIDRSWRCHQGIVGDAGCAKPVVESRGVMGLALSRAEFRCDGGEPTTGHTLKLPVWTGIERHMGPVMVSDDRVRNPATCLFPLCLLEQALSEMG